MIEKNEKRTIINRGLFRDEIRDHILELILSDELKPGERIVETRLAKELGVSQSPVREAIRELEMIGLIENKPFQGSYVRKITLKDAVDTGRVRLSLEELAIQDTAEIFTDEQLMKLDEIIKNMDCDMEADRAESFLKNDVLFHKSIIEAAENQTLLRLWNQCHIKDLKFIISKLTLKDIMLMEHRHRDIYNALKCHDKEKAQNAIGNHYFDLFEMLKTSK